MKARERMRAALVLAAVLALGLCLGWVGAAQAQGRSRFTLPKLPPPELYGDLLLDRATSAAGHKAVAFSHWSHRAAYTCRVCHTELEFAMARGESGITEAACREGRFCGACHDGKRAFGHDEGSCTRCHAGANSAGREASKLKNLPPAPFGNRVDWSAALAAGKIQPLNALGAPYAPMQHDKALVLEAEWAMISPAVFPHAEHNRWLDCSSCHPQPFNIEKKATPHFSMVFNLRGEFCGLCHLTVAFPLDDCKRCHPTMR